MDFDLIKKLDNMNENIQELKGIFYESNRKITLKKKLNNYSTDKNESNDLDFIKTENFCKHLKINKLIKNVNISDINKDFGTETESKNNESLIFSLNNDNIENKISLNDENGYLNLIKNTWNKLKKNNLNLNNCFKFKSNDIDNINNLEINKIEIIIKNIEEKKINKNSSELRDIYNNLIKLIC